MLRGTLGRRSAGLLALEARFSFEAEIYYSATGNVHQLARAVAEGAADAGADVRLLRVAETAPEAAIDSRRAWRAHVDATADIPLATSEDLR
jgi:NAD(P)H dehydrogenase (quinone)